MLLAQLLLRPIHVIRSGLTRLGRGEFGVRLDLNQEDEFGELGTFFNTVSAQLSADRSQMAGQVANLESAVEHLEDAVAIVSPNGRAAVCEPGDARAAARGRAPASRSTTLVGAGSPAAAPGRADARQPPVARADVGDVPGRRRGEPGERLILTHPVNDATGELVGVMLIARNLEYLEPGAVDGPVLAQAGGARPAVGRRGARGEESAERDDDSPRAAAAAVRRRAPAATPARGAGGRGVAVAAEAPPVDAAEALQHVDVIAGEIRRLDEVVQGFLKFTRPEDLKLQPVAPGRRCFDEVVPIVQPEAERDRRASWSSTATARPT